MQCVLSIFSVFTSLHGQLARKNTKGASQNSAEF